MQTRKVLTTQVKPSPDLLLRIRNIADKPTDKVATLDAKFTDLGFRYAKYTVNPTQKQIHTKYTAKYT